MPYLTLSSAVYAELENVLPSHIVINDGAPTIKNKSRRNNGGVNGGGNNNNKKKVSYEEMKLRRDRKRDRHGSSGGSDGDGSTKKSHSAAAAAAEAAICKQIFTRANLLQKVGLTHFKKIKKVLCREVELDSFSPKEKESFYNGLPEFESKAEWAVREESLSIAADWVKVPLDEIDQNNFFSRIQHRVTQLSKDEILQQGTQGWKDWARSNIDWKLEEWIDDYTKKAVSWLARRVIKLEDGGEKEEEEEEEDEDKCELYKYHFIRLKKEMDLLSKELSQSCLCRDQQSECVSLPNVDNLLSLKKSSIVKLLRGKGATVIVGKSLSENEEEEESETVEEAEARRVAKEAVHAAEEARLKAETEAKKKKTSKAAALEASEKAEEEKKKEAQLNDLNKTTKKKRAEQVTECEKKKKPEEQADWEEKERVEEVEKQRKRKQQLPKDIRRALASVLAKQEKKAEVEKAKQKQETEAAETRQREAVEEQERQKEARKMERKEERRKKKDERRLRKVEPAKWEQKKEWLQKEKTGQLGYCQFCDEKASIVCRGCYDVVLCIPSDCCAKIHSQKCSTYYVHEADEVD